MKPLSETFSLIVGYTEDGDDADITNEVAQLEKPDCIWTYDDVHDCWETTCGNAFVIIEGVPIENDMLYCPYCGGHLLDEEELSVASSNGAEK